MSQPASAAPSRKKTVVSLLVLAALTGIIVLLFKDNWAEITAALSQLSAWQVLVVLAIGLSYPLLEGCVAWVIVRSRIPGFRLWQGIDTAWCGTFGNVVTLGAGAVPVQLYYLHKAGLPLGPGAGLMTLEYVFHKSTVLLYATVMLLLQHRWLAANTTGVMRYLPMAYAVVAVIIVALVLLCVSPLVQNLARWLLGFLPKTEKWQQRRADWLEQLEVLGTESRRLLEWGFKNFSRQTVLDSTSLRDEVEVTLSKEANYVGVEPQGVLEATLPTDLDPAAFTREVVLNSQSVPAPVEKGQVLGHVTVSNGDTVYGTLDLVAVSNVERSELLYRLDQIKQFFSRAEVKLGLLVLLVVVLFLLLRWLLFGRRRRSRYGSGRGGYGGSHYRGRRRR